MRPLARLGLTSLCLFLGACSSSDVSVYSVKPGLSCVDDSAHCISQRQAVMRSYVSDGNKSWVKQPANVDAHASGVRLMAMQKRKRDLSCDELAHAKREADGAPAMLRGPAGKHLSLAQVARSAMLATEVSRELGREMGRRCARG